MSVNSGFNGSSVTELIGAGSSMMPGETALIQVVATVSLIEDVQNNGLGTYQNQVTITAFDDIGRSYDDVSVNGTEPDPDGNGDPTNNSSVSNGRLTPNGVVGVATNDTLAADDRSVVLDFRLEHFGNTPVDVSLIEDLTATLPTVSYTHLTLPTICSV